MNCARCHTKSHYSLCDNCSKLFVNILTNSDVDFPVDYSAGESLLHESHGCKLFRVLASRLSNLEGFV